MLDAGVVAYVAPRLLKRLAPQREALALRLLYHSGHVCEDGVGILLFVIVLPIGTVLNLAISVLGAFVHTARLQYIEFFGKFYEEGGRHFEPYRVNAKHVSIVADEKYGE